MIRGYLAAHGGVALVETPSRRAQRRRRRVLAVTSILGMAAATGLLGSLTQGTEASQGPVATRVFPSIPFQP